MGLILPGRAALPARRGSWLWAREAADGFALPQHDAFCPGWWEMSRLERDAGRRGFSPSFMGNK